MTIDQQKAFHNLLRGGYPNPAEKPQEPSIWTRIYDWIWWKWNRKRIEEINFRNDLLLSLQNIATSLDLINNRIGSLPHLINNRIGSLPQLYLNVPTKFSVTVTKKK